MVVCRADSADTGGREQTPLHFCFAYGYAELGEYLMEKGAADAGIRNHFGLTCHEGLGLKTPLQQCGNFYKMDPDPAAAPESAGRS